MMGIAILYWGTAFAIIVAITVLYVYNLLKYIEQLERIIRRQIYTIRILKNRIK